MRRPSVDALRGLVIVLMALDHTQYFWSAFGLPDDGLDGLIPSYPSAWHQLTRLLSHICAPTFLFLAGMMLAGKTDKRRIAFRAVLLIALQFSLENLAWWPKGYLGEGYKYFGILACIGFSMLVVLALSRFKPRVTLSVSCLALLLSAWIDAAVPQGGALKQALAAILYAPTLNPSYPLTSLFPLVPWFGFMGLGYCFGERTRDRTLAPTARPLAAAGCAAIACAIALRWLNGFGNRIHWRGEPFGPEFFVLSKYPPSLIYVLLALGVLALLLALAIRFEAALAGPRTRFLIVFGQASLFFYVVHLYLYGAVAYVLDRNVRVDLAMTWAVWLIGLVPLFYLCKGYQELKARRPGSWLRYI